MRGLVLSILVSIFACSCAINPRDFAIEGVALLGGNANEGVSVELSLRNDSAKQITVESGEVNVELKRERILSFVLTEAVVIPPLGSVKVVSKWQIRQDDPATLYSMRRHSPQRYLEMVTFGYNFEIKGLNRRGKRLSGRGLKAEDMNFNVEKLLR